MIRLGLIVTLFLNIQLKARASTHRPLEVWSGSPVARRRERNQEQLLTCGGRLP